MKFEDRRQAGRMLSYFFQPSAHANAAVLALSPGGIPVAFEIARWLSAPLALARLEGINGMLDLDEVSLQLERLDGSSEPIRVRNRAVILVDDAITTGVAAVATGHLLEEMEARHVLLAAPVCDVSILAALNQQFDAVICLSRQEMIRSPESYYESRLETEVSPDELRSLRAA